MDVARDLIFDVGMHKGEDTAFYVRKGYRVVAFEANPGLVKHCRERFAAEIDSGRVRIIEGAISQPGQDTVTFRAHKHNTIWGTANSVFVERNPGEIDQITVGAVDFGAHLTTETPWYIKIDIEGAGGECLRAIGQSGCKPALMSMESEKVSFGTLVDEIDGLAALGYDRFATVQQDLMSRKTISTVDRDGRAFNHCFEYASSGPFGEDLDEQWLTRDEVITEYRKIFRRYAALGDDAWINRTRVGFEVRRNVQRALGVALPGWYDTHAARSSD